MISFEYSQDQMAIREVALKFARKEMRPWTAHYDEAQEFPRPILQKAWEQGFLNTCIPEEFGGQSLETVTATLISECLAYGCLGMNTAIMANDLALLPIALGGSTEQKEKFLRPFTESYKIASFCLTEPDHGSNAAGIETTLEEKGDFLELTGNKMWITNAGVADLFVVYATINKDLGRKGITAVVVEADSSGISLGAKEKKMGHRCSDTRTVTFSKVKVSKANILRGIGQGWNLAMETLNHSRCLVASSAVGGAQAALDHAKNYAGQRLQFGRPIGEFQMIQAMLANMAMKIEASRLLVQKAAWLVDQKTPDPKICSMAKAFASDTCMEVATDAVQIFGGLGYGQEYPVEKIMRDAKLLQIYEGTSQIQRLVIAKEVLKQSDF